MSNRIWTLLPGLAAPLVALVAACPMLGSPAAFAEDPEIVYQNLNDGQIIAEPPFVIQMCFSRPIDIRDQADDGDWDFDINTPQGQGSAIRIVFQPDAYGVAMYPVAPPSIPGIPNNETNDWVFIYHVADQESGDSIDGQIHFKVSEDASPIPRETPPSCVPTGGTGEATPPPVTGADETPTNTGVPTPSTNGSATEETTSEPASGSSVPSGSGSATATPGTGDDDDDGGSDALVFVLVGLGALGAVGGAGGAAYYIRRRRKRS